MSLDQWFLTQSYFWWYNEHLSFCLNRVFLPAAKIVVQNLIGEKEAKKLNLVSFFNDTVKHQIHDMSDYITNEVTIAVRASKYATQ